MGLSAGALTLLEVASLAGAYLAWGNWMSITLPTKMEFFRFAPASGSLPETIAGMVLGSLPGVLILYLVRTKPERMIWLSLLISLVCVALYCFATILAGRRFELKRETIVGSISFLFLLGFVLLLCAPVANRAQESKDDLVRVRTRVVFVDTLVQDKQTGAPVADLTRANFEILADGKPRTLSYFSRAAEGHRRPLALLLVLDLVARDTGEYLRRADVLESLSGALKKLSSEDELAMVASLGGPGAPLKTITDFTRDRARMTEALATVRNLPLPQPRTYDEELENVSQMAERAARERPDSQIIVLTVTSTFAPAAISQRNKVAARLIRANIFYSPLISDAGKGTMRIGGVPGKYPAPPLPVLDTLARLGGQDSHAPQYLAQQTGGEITHIHQPEDYGASLEKLIAGLAARYNLGFTLQENEQDDGRMHKLEVRTKVRDTKGKERKFTVLARRGYYLKIQDSRIEK